MADLHAALQGAKIRDDIYILRKLHRGNEDDTIPLDHATTPRLGPPSPSRPVEEPSPRPASKESKRPTQKPEAPGRPEKHQGIMAFDFSTPPPAGPEDLPSLVRWFLSHDRLIPNNLQILEEAHRILCGAEGGRSYERHLTSAIADDLRLYDSRDLLQEHLTLLSTVYARALQALRRIGSQQPDLQSPADLPEPQRLELWERCLILGVAATRLRVEGWIFVQQYGEAPPLERPAPQRKAKVRPRKEKHQGRLLVR